MKFQKVEKQFIAFRQQQGDEMEKKFMIYKDKLVF